MLPTLFSCGFGFAKMSSFITSIKVIPMLGLTLPPKKDQGPDKHQSLLGAEIEAGRPNYGSGVQKTTKELGRVYAGRSRI